jgi:hypothetical protein
MTRRLTLAVALTFGLVAAAAATWLLATLEPVQPRTRPEAAAPAPRPRSEPARSTPGAPEPSDDIGEPSRTRLREILRETE